jgi:hypothetical protein
MATSNGTSGWRIEYCSPTGDVVDFFIGKTGCSAVAVCGKGYACPSDPTEPPGLDPGKAIAAAFPNDKDSTLYEVVFGSKGGRVWFVARKQAPDQYLYVDADTGAPLP